MFGYIRFGVSYLSRNSMAQSVDVHSHGLAYSHPDTTYYTPDIR